MNGSRVSLGRWLLFWTVALGGAAFDLATKQAIFAWVGPPGSSPKPLISNILELRTSFNTGALWGLGAGSPYASTAFAFLSILAALSICYWLFVLGRATDLGLTIALALIMAGAIGNCYDRLAFGHVRDFVHFHVDSVGFNFAIFNFADNMLVAGAALLMILAFRPEPAPDDPQPASANGHRDASPPVQVGP